VLRQCLGEVHIYSEYCLPNFVGIDLIKFYIEGMTKAFGLFFFLAQYIEGEYKK